MSKLSSWKMVLSLGGLWVATAVASPAQTTFTSLFSFNGTDGANPDFGTLVQGTDGNFYGTVSDGGAAGAGTVFKITPSGTLTTLYSFCAQNGCTDGSDPLGGLILAGDGNFLGTTKTGGTYDDGTVFEITPGGTLTTVLSFDGGDGERPRASLVQDKDGNVYGTTSYGGASGSGTVFRITPAGTLTTVYNFCSQANCADGASPFAPLILGSDGNFYGTTASGGAVTQACASAGLGQGCGTVFKITSGGALTTLYAFCSLTNCADGGFPIAGVTQGIDGNFYGATVLGGSSGNCTEGCGTIFKLTANGTLTTLHSFAETDGFSPAGELLQATDQDFYGTTAGCGADGNCTYGLGTIFRITSAGALTTLHSFAGTDGSNPIAGLLQEPTTGIFYGTSAYGGAAADGTVFSLSVGLGSSPGASFSPASLVFAPQFVGTTSPAQTVTLTNTGNAALTITSVASSGDFAETNNCGSSLAAGASCTINATFTPTQGGNFTGTISVTDNAPGSPQTVALDGTGAVGAELAKSPTLNVDFYGDGKADVGIWRPAIATWYILSNDGGSNLTQVQGQSGDVPVTADYDGDGKSDFAVWQPSTGTWFIIPSSNPGAPATVAWGNPGDVPVPADYDGDGVTDVAVWRPSIGTWYILPSDGGPEITKVWGQAGDIPVIGDYDGDGKADYAVWRPSTGTWWVVLSSTGKIVSQVWGEPGDIPVEGDYDGDGKTDYAVWRPDDTTWYIILSSTGAIVQETWGALGDIPVVGDYNGDGKNDYGVFRPSDATWYIEYSSGGTLSQQWGETSDIPVSHLPSIYRRDKHIANFDGDRKADIGVFRPSDGTWYVIDSSTGKSVTQAFGETGDIIVPGDYDGDGKTDYAVWRPSTQTWWVVLSSTGKTVSQQWGASGDIPVPGDYDGDGKTDYAVFRPSTGTWYLTLSSTGQQISQPWGASGDIPVPADYDGDGKTDYAVFRPSNATWYVIFSSTGKAVTQQWGASGDIPVPGDYDGDTKTDYTVFRPSTGTWYTLQSSNGKTITTVLGLYGDIPVAKDYDGDEKTDIAVFRPSNGTWYILQSSNGKTTSTVWGVSTDVPVSLPTGQPQ